MIGDSMTPISISMVNHININVNINVNVPIYERPKCSQYHHHVDPCLEGYFDCDFVQRLTQSLPPMSPLNRPEGGLTFPHTGSSKAPLKVKSTSLKEEKTSLLFLSTLYNFVTSVSAQSLLQKDLPHFLGWSKFYLAINAVLKSTWALVWSLGSVVDGDWFEQSLLAAAGRINTFNSDLKLNIVGGVEEERV